MFDNHSHHKRCHTPRNIVRPAIVTLYDKELKVILVKVQILGGRFIDIPNGNPPEIGSVVLVTEGPRGWVLAN